MRPLNPADGAVERFACELRALRAAAGEVPFWKMARRCGLSKSALAAAVAGRQLPSARVMAAFVLACGGNVQWWSERLEQARSQLEAERTEPAPDELSQHTAGAELVLRRPAVLIPTMARNSAGNEPLAFRGGRSLDRSHTSARRRAMALAVGAILACAAAAALFLGLHATPDHADPASHVAATASLATRFQAPAALSGTMIYNETTGPGCDMVFPPGTTEQVAQAAPDNSVDMEHDWVQATSDEPHWAIADCSNTMLVSQPTTEDDPTQWQNSYEYKFYSVPAGVPCVFHIYIADSPQSQYNATYDWTNGNVVDDWVDGNAFTIDQRTHAGTWYTDRPHTYATGKAYLMLNDERGKNPVQVNAPLTASEVQLTCTQ